MLRRILLLVLASLFLTACGRGSEDYSILVQRPVDKVMPRFAGISPPGEFVTLVPGIKFDSSQSGSDRLVYEVPGKGDFPSRIALQFEPVEGGRFTRIHVAVDVPAVKSKILGAEKVLSEEKVQQVLHKILSDAADELEKGGSITKQTKDLAELLAALAIVTDPAKVDRMLAIKDYPEWYLDGASLWDLYGASDYPAQSSLPQSNPDADVAQQAWREKSARVEAAEPMDDAEGEEPRPERGGD